MEENVGMIDKPSWEEAFVRVKGYFQKEAMEEFFKKNGNNVSADELIDFVNSSFIKERFKNQWNYENNSKIWGNRDPRTIFLQASIYTFAILAPLAYFRLQGQNIADFEGFSDDEVQRIKTLTIMASDYLYVKML